MTEHDVAPGEDTGRPAGDLQSDEASGAEVPREDAGSDAAGRDDVPVYEDPNDR